MITTLITIAIIAVIALALITAALWQGQERVVWQPPAVRVPDPAGVRRIDFVADDSQPLFAYVVGDTGAVREALLVFHGNADLAVWLVPWAQETARRTGALVVLAEYRGYGGLSGTPNYEGSRRDARAAYDAVRRLAAIPPDSITLFGHSLGSAIAAELASALDSTGSAPRALVLQSPFTSVRDMARLIAPALLMWDAIARVHFDTEARVRALHAPVWVAHGTRDLIIPARMGQRVYAAAARKGELLMVPGAGHNDVPESGGEAYWRWLEHALGRVTTGERAAAD